MADHPRSRGEYPIGHYREQSPQGSSPLSRGIPIGSGATFSRRWIIPALAGNTRFRSEIARIRDGSSPLSRGIRIVDNSVWRTYRIIPALAGNTWENSGRVLSTEDHPRSRGEYYMKNRAVETARGSSPLSRGIPILRLLRGTGRRIIPALAGNTIFFLASIPDVPDHPRSRGEYRSATVEPIFEYGSSPLSRGIPTAMLSTLRSTWIIPALAGNTLTADLVQPDGGDHPRSRGEYPPHQTLPGGVMGSSPLSRGIRSVSRLA